MESRGRNTQLVVITLLVIEGTSGGVGRATFTKPSQRDHHRANDCKDEDELVM